MKSWEVLLQEIHEKLIKNPWKSFFRNPSNKSCGNSGRNPQQISRGSPKSRKSCKDLSLNLAFIRKFRKDFSRNLTRNSPEILQGFLWKSCKNFSISTFLEILQALFWKSCRDFSENAASISLQMLQKLI